jgi:hypothetical protein
VTVHYGNLDQLDLICQRLSGEIIYQSITSFPDARKRRYRSFNHIDGAVPCFHLLAWQNPPGSSRPCVTVRAV